MSISNMSLSMSLKKDERKYKIEEGIRSGKLRTVSSCAREAEVTQNTIRKYLKEMNISIYDDEKKEMTKSYNSETKIVYPFD